MKKGTYRMMKYMLAFLLLFSAVAQAQDSVPEYERIKGLPEVLDSIKQLADDNISRGHDSEGKALAPLSEEEKINGVIPKDDANRIIDYGAFTAYALWCGHADWENKLFLPFMENERTSHAWTDRQMAYVGLLHGISMGYLEQQLAKKEKGCQPADKEKVEAFIATEKNKGKKDAAN